MRHSTTATSASPVAIKLDAADRLRLQSLAEIRQRKPHYLMNEAIRQYLDREEEREKFKQHALNSWREYRETGLHLTGDEATQWLQSWGTDNAQIPPECHE